MKETPIINSSFEAEELQKLINNKISFYNKLENETAKKFLQKEILFLRDEILPIVYKNTSVLFSEIAKYSIKSFEKANKYNANGVLIYIPIKDKYKEKPRIAVANSKNIYGTAGGVSILCESVSIKNFDGLGDLSIEPYNIVFDDKEENTPRPSKEKLQEIFEFCENL